MFKMIEVKSSNIKAVGYDAKEQKLYVEFHYGAKYVFPDVPQEEYEALVGAKSIGGHFVRHIKGIYGGTKL